MELKDKTIILTGASGGIGEAIARQLSTAGAKLILLGRNPQKLQALEQALDNPVHSSLAADLTSHPDRQRLLSYCKDLPGGIDLLINNAGISHFGLFESTDDEQLEQLITTNLSAPIQLIKTLLPLLQQQPEAAIVNIGSTFGSIGYPGFSGYCASKFGLRGFTEALRRELSGSSIKVMYLAPRATRTAINSDSVNAMNKELGTAVDSPDVVAVALIKQLQGSHWRDTYLGWPEKLFVRINGVLPILVDNALIKQLPVIRRFSKQSSTR